MRSPFKFSFSSMLRQQRRLEKTVLKAVKASRKAIALSPFSTPAPVKPSVRPAKKTSGKLEEVTGFGSNPARLHMLRYVPPQLPRKAPLVVVLHGCQQNARDYDHGSGWSTLARERGFAVLYAEQTRGNNANLCFNWFRPSNVTRDRGEVMSIRQMIERMVTAHGIDRKRIYVTGLSAGGAMTAAMLSTYPELFAGGGIIAGLPYGAARDVHRALAAMKKAPDRSAREWGDLVRTASPHAFAGGKMSLPSVSVWHGTRDHTVALSNAEALLQQWLDLHGLDPARFIEGQVEGHTKRSWKDASGRVAVEFHLIEGMGHGTPLKPRAASRSRADTPGPFMLDAGISSTTRLADSWGLKKQTLLAR
ncbi:feruloyl esterase [Pararhizobium capsulatum DSM 1112]|uniref:Feruloyl esterase n=1 Tax=Pararhizobium capsulatum DSM 1112 TaxID=1121113 RepID=A0ABU0BNB0_9HYPH|nr:PHB depolymerase family esterase [Pararhizobium capsulatum]MDQ0319403.1 feruloyl esterase [Pararhizobium capsulatum DSM 1112]